MEKTPYISAIADSATDLQSSKTALEALTTAKENIHFGLTQTLKNSKLTIQQQQELFFINLVQAKVNTQLLFYKVEDVVISIRDQIVNFKATPRHKKNTQSLPPLEMNNMLHH